MNLEPFIDEIYGLNKQLGREAFSPCYEIFCCCTGQRKMYRDAFIKSLEEILINFSQPFRWYKTNTMKWPKSLNNNAQEIAGNYFESIITNPTKLAGIEFHCGIKKEDYKTPSLAFFSTIVPTDQSDIRQSRTYLRICVPITVENAHEIIRQISHNILSICPIYSGHCGWSFYWSMVDTEEKNLLEARARNWFKRYPGLFYGKPLSFLEFIGDGLITISWLTYLSKQAIEAHGESLENVIILLKQKGISNNLITDQVLEVQATDQPELGDRNRNDMLSAYSQVGKVLAFAGLTENQAIYLPIAGIEMDERVEWYQRFFN